jgi:transcriptional regulator with XRE-family HTH domain
MFALVVPFCTSDALARSTQPPSQQVQDSDRSDEFGLAREFGARLREIRERAGLSQEEIAARLGIAQPYLSRVERGLANPSLRVCERLVDAVGHSLVLDFRRRETDSIEERLEAAFEAMISNMQEAVGLLRSWRSAQKGD